MAQTPELLDAHIDERHRSYLKFIKNQKKEKEERRGGEERKRRSPVHTSVWRYYNRIIINYFYEYLLG
jgi:hypothetical protein